MKIQEGGFSFRLSDNVWREVRQQKESILVSYDGICATILEVPGLYISITTKKRK